MRRVGLVAVLAAGLAGCATSAPTNFVPASDMRADAEAMEATVERVVARWDPQPRRLARQLIHQYGQPMEATPTRLIWYNNGPWARTELVNRGAPHRFPAPHEDLLLQSVHYRVPADRLDQVASFHGSILVDRTKGELAARCDSEAANIAALNLADAIIQDRLNIEQARELYSRAVQAPGQSEYARRLQLPTSQADAAEPDQAVIASAASDDVDGWPRLVRVTPGTTATPSGGVVALTPEHFSPTDPPDARSADATPSSM